MSDPDQSPKEEAEPKLRSWEISTKSLGNRTEEPSLSSKTVSKFSQQPEAIPQLSSKTIEHLAERKDSEPKITSREFIKRTANDFSK
jgi:hypothetical protein